MRNTTFIDTVSENDLPHKSGQFGLLMYSFDIKAIDNSEISFQKIGNQLET